MYVTILGALFSCTCAYAFVDVDKNECNEIQTGIMITAADVQNIFLLHKSVYVPNTKFVDQRLMTFFDSRHPSARRSLAAPTAGFIGTTIKGL